MNVCTNCINFRRLNEGAECCVEKCVFVKKSDNRFKAWQCRKCGKNLHLRDEDAGSEREERRLCDNCL